MLGIRQHEKKTKSTWSHTMWAFNVQVYPGLKSNITPLMHSQYCLWYSDLN
uniref:Uncharacterized protein n=1 Tax=Anguilla anguilla TaxID=7936 RepID=A0A0E9RZ18_ANGAN